MVYLINHNQLIKLNSFFEKLCENDQNLSIKLFNGAHAHSIHTYFKENGTFPRLNLFADSYLFHKTFNIKDEISLANMINFWFLKIELDQLIIYAITTGHNNTLVGLMSFKIHGSYLNETKFGFWFPTNKAIKQYFPRVLEILLSRIDLAKEIFEKWDFEVPEYEINTLQVANSVFYECSSYSHISKYQKLYTFTLLSDRYNSNYITSKNYYNEEKNSLTGRIRNHCNTHLSIIKYMVYDYTNSEAILFSTLPHRSRHELPSWDMYLEISSMLSTGFRILENNINFALEVDNKYSGALVIYPDSYHIYCIKYHKELDCWNCFEHFGTYNDFEPELIALLGEYFTTRLR
jgi:hypothetical protein